MNGVTPQASPSLEGAGSFWEYFGGKRGERRCTAKCMLWTIPPWGCGNTFEALPHPSPFLLGSLQACVQPQREGEPDTWTLTSGSSFILRVSLCNAPAPEQSCSSTHSFQEEAAELRSMVLRTLRSALASAAQFLRSPAARASVTSR